MKTTFYSGLAILALSACASDGDAPEARATAAMEVVIPNFDGISAGREGYFYHQLWGDCSALDHGHGRNYSWGHWRMPLEAVSYKLRPSEDKSGFVVEFTCKRGDACIESGFLDDLPERIETHIIPFENTGYANVYLSRVEELKAACKAAAGG